MSGQGSVSQAIIGTIALGVVYDSSNSQVALRDTNVHVDAIILLKEHINISVYNQASVLATIHSRRNGLCKVFMMLCSMSQNGTATRC